PWNDLMLMLLQFTTRSVTASPLRSTLKVFVPVAVMAMPLLPGSPIIVSVPMLSTLAEATGHSRSSSRSRPGRKRCFRRTGPALVAAVRRGTNWGANSKERKNSRTPRNPRGRATMGEVLVGFFLGASKDRKNCRIPPERFLETDDIESTSEET